MSFTTAPSRRRRSVPVAVVAAMVAVLALSVPLSDAPAQAATATPVMAQSRVTSTQLADWYRSKGKSNGATVSIDALAWYFIQEGSDEGVAGDLAFAQTMVETGYLGFSARAPGSNNNFSGLGAVDGGSSSAAFPDARTGVRAQIQHLRAYADPTVTTANLAHPLVDGRFKYVAPKGKAPNWEQFGGGVWASDTSYATKVLGIYQQILDFAGVNNPAPTTTTTTTTIPSLPPSSWRPFDSATALVTQSHRDLLAREATAAEIARDAAALDRRQVEAAGYLASLVDGEASLHGKPVVRLYLAALGRLPDRSGLQYWTARHARGDAIAILAQGFLDSGEFEQRYGSRSLAGYVDLLYMNVLGRNADAAGATYWVERLESGRTNRRNLLVFFSDSAENVARTGTITEASVVYLGMLLRSPDPSLLTWWADKRATGSGLESLTRMVYASAEYAARFGS